MPEKTLPDKGSKLPAAAIAALVNFNIRTAQAYGWWFCACRVFIHKGPMILPGTMN